jgi:hypothetical protein
MGILEFNKIGENIEMPKKRENQPFKELFQPSKTVSRNSGRTIGFMCIIKYLIKSK